MANKQIGFGYIPANGGFHIAVTIPPPASGCPVRAYERYDHEEAPGGSPYHMSRHSPVLKVEVDRLKFLLVADAVKADFNRRLKELKLKAGRWTRDDNLFDRLMGKELVLLLWAIEDADIKDVPNALANWQGLAPEERWWLYTTINAATGHYRDGRGKGWRKAIRIALTENPTSAATYFS
jgi:hypothetical protein